MIQAGKPGRRDLHKLSGLTGCADKQIRIFQTSGTQVRSIQAPEVVRALCRLPPNHPSGAHFASAGNDAVIRLWTLNGQQVAELL